MCLHLPLLVFHCDFASDLSILGSSEDKDCVVGSKGPCVPTQKSYTSSETFKTFDQPQEETRLELGLHTCTDGIAILHPVPCLCVDGWEFWVGFPALSSLMH